MSPAGEATGFIDWLALQEPGALYAAFAAVCPGERIPQPGDLERRREKFVKVLKALNDCYFSSVDPRILEALKADAEQKARLVSGLPGREIVELATNGLQVDDTPGLDSVRITPQYHCRPMNLIDIYGTNEMVYFYPVETPEDLSDGIPQRLLRMGDAISDASRLKILRFLKSGPHTFTEIVGFTGLYKSTVHYHLVILRAAGLLTIHMSGYEADNYSLRPKAIDMLASTMRSFLGVEKA
jgi:DNA-binding transcriptional ArsR family regulator